PIQLPDVTVPMSEEKVTDHVSVQVEDETLSPYYGAFLVKDLEIKQAPLWMRNYLIAAGIRPINNVVDITNYVLLEYGQQLHAFDRVLIETDEIVVRRAKKEEKKVTLNNQERKMNNRSKERREGKKGQIERGGDRQVMK